MPERIDHPSPADPTRKPPPWQNGAVVVFALGAVIGLGWLVMPRGRSGSARSVIVVEPKEVARSFATSLMQWDVFRDSAPRKANYAEFLDAVQSQITSAQGVSLTSGDQGQGCDWYEFDLSTDLANGLRAALRQSSEAQHDAVPPKVEGSPAWWPREWPAGVHCYSEEREYLFLSDTDNHAWFLRPRG
jgi:hypothetical protein